MMFSSRWCSSVLRWYEFNLLYRNLIAEYLCCCGWFDVYGISVSVKVGFLNIEIFMPGGVCGWLSLGN